MLTKPDFIFLKKINVFQLSKFKNLIEYVLLYANQLFIRYLVTMILKKKKISIEKKLWPLLFFKALATILMGRATIRPISPNELPG